MSFARLDRAPGYRLLAEAVEREILEGRLKPGDKLPTETEFATQFAVNRSTVREGIRLLEHGGLVQRDSSRRLSVGLPHYDRLATRATRALVLHEVTFRELFEATMVLSIASIELAVERVTQEEIDRLDANIRATEAARDDIATIAALDSEFHIMLEKAGRNRVLELAREPSNMLIHPSTQAALGGTPYGPDRLIEAHRMLVESLRRRDKDMARTWTRRHLVDWRKGFEKAGLDLDQPVDLVTARAD